jgi:hypothetical protein
MAERAAVAEEAGVAMAASWKLGSAAEPLVPSW